MIDFQPIPGCPYKYDYEAIFRDIADCRCEAIPTYRALILDDLFFILHFALGVEECNHPFVVRACRDVECGPDTDTLDVWAREHWKSSIMTLAENLQLICKISGIAIGIFSHNRPIAKGFLRQIKGVAENNELFKACFPDIFWADPAKESPKWSEDEGLRFKRQGYRKEETVEAWGLLDGMPTGKHFDHRVYDDVETDDVVGSPEMVLKLRRRYAISQNLGREGGSHRVIGTYYTHEGLLTHIRDLHTPTTDELQYVTRTKPATHDGTENGTPVLKSQEDLDKLKANEYVFNCQQLCNPTPVGVRRLNSDFLVYVKAQDVPKDLMRFLIIDQAGDNPSNPDPSSDSWAMGLIGVNVDSDDAGLSDIYLLDALIEPMGETEAIEEAVRMYLRGGMVQAVGVEKVGLATTHLHIQKALKAKGRHVSEDAGSLILLSPSGRNKVKRIESALAWPLANSKIHISSTVPDQDRERIKTEMDRFPYWHDDGLDMLSYLYDMLTNDRVKYRPQKQKALPQPKMGIV